MQQQLEEAEQGRQQAVSQAVIHRDEVKGLQRRLSEQQEENQRLKEKVEMVSCQMGVPRGEYEAAKLAIGSKDKEC